MLFNHTDHVDRTSFVILYSFILLFGYCFKNHTYLLTYLLAFVHCTSVYRSHHIVVPSRPGRRLNATTNQLEKRILHCWSQRRWTDLSIKEKRDQNNSCCKTQTACRTHERRMLLTKPKNVNPVKFSDIRHIMPKLCRNFLKLVWLTGIPLRLSILYIVTKDIGWWIPITTVPIITDMKRNSTDVCYSEASTRPWTQLYYSTVAC